LLLEGAEQQRAQSWRTWLDILAIRFRGIDPESFLSWLYPRVRWFYSPWLLGGYLLLVVSALLLLFAEADEFRAQLPGIGEFLSARNVLWLAVIIGATKVIHEFAHAVTCKHFGGECHEMGVMLLVFTPCLYCNVTDSWMLRSRHQRIAISAAGMLAEVGLASLAVFGWWLTQPGIAHTICLNTILVCGMSTVLFNGNPLLRYDGYFILSDLLEIPNLWQESRRVIQQGGVNWILADETSPLRRLGSSTAVLAAYGVASMCYRAVVAVAILLFLYRWLQPAGFGIVAQLAATSLIVGVTANWTKLFWQGAKGPQFWRPARAMRIVVAASLIAAAAAVIFILPLPCNISAPALIEPAAARRIYVSTPGTLISAVSAGAPVSRGQVLALLKDAGVSREVAERRAEYAQAQTRVRHLEVRSAIDAAAAAELVVSLEACADAEQRLNKRLREERALTLTAPVSGTVIPPPAIRRTADERQLDSWSGTPLVRRNQQCFLERGALLCIVGDPERQEALAYVDGDDVLLLRAGQRARLQFDVGPAVILTGQVVEVAERDVSEVPVEFVPDSEIASRADDGGRRRPLRPTYQVRVMLDDAAPAGLVIGTRGQAKFEVDPQTISQRMLRALRRALAIEI